MVIPKIFSPDFNSYLPVIKKFMDENKWDLFYFGGNHCGNKWKKISDKIREVHDMYTTHAYIINEDCYERILNGYNEDLVIDQVLLNTIQPANKSFCCLPNIAYQRDEFSFIMDGNRSYKTIRKG